MALFHTQIGHFYSKKWEVDICKFNVGPFLTFYGSQVRFLGDKIGILTNLRKLKKNSFLPQIYKENRFRENSYLFSRCPLYILWKSCYIICFIILIFPLLRDPALRACYVHKLFQKKVIWKYYIFIWNCIPILVKSKNGFITLFYLKLKYAQKYPYVWWLGKMMCVQ